MEFTIDAVASKMIFLIVCLSALIVVGGFIFFHVSTAFELNEAVPFGVGVAMAMGLNITKVIWLKRTINWTVDMDTPKVAKLHYQMQYFLRLLFTAVVLLVAALAPDNIINLFGVIIGIFTFPITMRLLQFFIPPDTVINKEGQSTDFVQDSINEIESLANTPSSSEKGAE